MSMRGRDRISARPTTAAFANATVLRRLLALGHIILCGVLLSACQADLYSNLDQKQANDIVAALVHRGIPATRQVGKSGRLTVSIDQSRFADAVRILNEQGLPKEDFSSLGDVFKKDGLVSSPVQERAQMIFALSQELSRTVSSIDGVLSARVHLVLPENDPLQQRLIPSSASVFIRHFANVPISDLIPQIKTLVANGIAGLSYDKVSVVLIPVAAADRGDADAAVLASFFGLWLHQESLARAKWLIYGLLAVILALAAALGWALWLPRHRVFPLANAVAGSRP
jgi:type III secretion protein J